MAIDHSSSPGSNNIPLDIEPDFDAAEYCDRYNRLVAAADDLMVDAMLLTRHEDFAWACGYKSHGMPFEVLVIPNSARAASSPPFFTTRLLENSNAENLPWIKDLFPYSDAQDPIETFINALRQRNLADNVTLGIQLEFLSAKRYFALQQGLPSVKFVDCSRKVESYRVVRSPKEIEHFKNSAKLTEAGVSAGLAALQVGVTENEIAAAVFNQIAGTHDDSRWPAYPPFVALGPYAIRCHRTFEGHRCTGVTRFADGTEEPGQLLFLEVGASYKGYHTSMMRTAFVGDVIPEWLSEAESLLQEAVSTCIAMLKPGVLPSDVDRAAREILGRRTFEAEQLGRTGYTIGAGFSPDWSDADFSLVGTERRPLREGQVFHLIPYLQTKYGAIGLSETVLVTADGGQQLTGLLIPRNIWHVKPTVSPKRCDTPASSESEPERSDTPVTVRMLTRSNASGSEGEDDDDLVRKEKPALPMVQPRLIGEDGKLSDKKHMKPPNPPVANTAPLLSVAVASLVVDPETPRSPKRSVNQAVGARCGSARVTTRAC
mmetsp:Transcript_1993/g.4573  ORF Transcript_1993/g.4573 Transcript_1993/m.4573 type:complete len:544 (+) Transcript_1993:63-1694(+)